MTNDRSPIREPIFSCRMSGPVADRPEPEAARLLSLLALPPHAARTGIRIFADAATQRKGGSSPQPQALPRLAVWNSGPVGLQVEMYTYFGGSECLFLSFLFRPRLPLLWPWLGSARGRQLSEKKQEAYIYLFDFFFGERGGRGVGGGRGSAEPVPHDSHMQVQVHLRLFYRRALLFEALPAAADPGPAERPGETLNRAPPPRSPTGSKHQPQLVGDELCFLRASVRPPERFLGHLGCLGRREYLHFTTSGWLVGHCIDVCPGLVTPWGRDITACNGCVAYGSVLMNRQLESQWSYWEPEPVKAKQGFCRTW